MTLPRLFIHTSILLALSVALAIAATRPTPTQHISVTMPAAERPDEAGGQPRGLSTAVPDIAASDHRGLHRTIRPDMCRLAFRPRGAGPTLS